eukprot:14987820-Alexandrium_andersonii.AAC.1
MPNTTLERFEALPGTFGRCPRLFDVLMHVRCIQDAEQNITHQTTPKAPECAGRRFNAAETVGFFFSGIR